MKKFFEKLRQRDKDTGPLETEGKTETQKPLKGDANGLSNPSITQPTKGVVKIALFARSAPLDDSPSLSGAPVGHTSPSAPALFEADAPSSAGSSPSGDGPVPLRGRSLSSFQIFGQEDDIGADDSDGAVSLTSADPNGVLEQATMAENKTHLLTAIRDNDHEEDEDDGGVFCPIDAFIDAPAYNPQNDDDAVQVSAAILTEVANRATGLTSQLESEQYTALAGLTKLLLDQTAALQSLDQFITTDSDAGDVAGGEVSRGTKERKRDPLSVTKEEGEVQEDQRSNRGLSAPLEKPSGKYASSTRSSTSGGSGVEGITPKTSRVANVRKPSHYTDDSDEPEFEGEARHSRNSRRRSIGRKGIHRHDEQSTKINQLDATSSYGLAASREKRHSQRLVGKQGKVTKKGSDKPSDGEKEESEGEEGLLGDNTLPVDRSTGHDPSLVGHADVVYSNLQTHTHGHASSLAPLHPPAISSVLLVPHRSRGLEPSHSFTSILPIRPSGLQPRGTAVSLTRTGQDITTQSNTRIPINSKRNADLMGLSPRRSAGDIAPLTVRNQRTFGAASLSPPQSKSKQRIRKLNGPLLQVDADWTKDEPGYSSSDDDNDDDVPPTFQPNLHDTDPLTDPPDTIPPSHSKTQGTQNKPSKVQDTADGDAGLIRAWGQYLYHAECLATSPPTPYTTLPPLDREFTEEQLESLPLSLRAFIPVIPPTSSSPDLSTQLPSTQLRIDISTPLTPNVQPISTLASSTFSSSFSPPSSLLMSSSPSTISPSLITADPQHAGHTPLSNPFTPHLSTVASHHRPSTHPPPLDIVTPTAPPPLLSSPISSPPTSSVPPTFASLSSSSGASALVSLLQHFVPIFDPNPLNSQQPSITSSLSSSASTLHPSPLLSFPPRDPPLSSSSSAPNMRHLHPSTTLSPPNASIDNKASWLVRDRGVPSSLRALVWLSLSGAASLIHSHSPRYYMDLCMLYHSELLYWSLPNDAASNDASLQQSPLPPLSAISPASSSHGAHDAVASSEDPDSPPQSTSYPSYHSYYSFLPMDRQGVEVSRKRRSSIVLPPPSTSSASLHQTFAFSPDTPQCLPTSPTGLHRPSTTTLTASNSASTTSPNPILPIRSHSTSSLPDPSTTPLALPNVARSPSAHALVADASLFSASPLASAEGSATPSLEPSALSSTSSQGIPPIANMSHGQSSSRSRVFALSSRHSQTELSTVLSTSLLTSVGDPMQTGTTPLQPHTETCPITTRWTTPNDVSSPPATHALSDQAELGSFNLTSAQTAPTMVSRNDSGNTSRGTTEGSPSLTTPVHPISSSSDGSVCGEQEGSDTETLPCFTTKPSPDCPSPRPQRHTVENMDLSPLAGDVLNHVLPSSTPLMLTSSTSLENTPVEPTHSPSTAHLSSPQALPMLPPVDTSISITDSGLPTQSSDASLVLASPNTNSSTVASLGALPPAPSTHLAPATRPAFLDSDEEVKKDLLRTLPELKLFQTTEGLQRLYRILTAYSVRNAEAVGYCQSANFIAAVLLKFLFDSALENLSAQRRHALDSATRRLETLRSQVEHAQLSSSSSLKELVYSPDHCTQRSDIPITDSSLSDHHSSTSDEKPRMNMVNLQAELLRQQAHCDRLAAAASTPLTVSALPPEVVDVCEEIAFWLLTAVIESRLGYYSRNMCGIDVDVKVLSTLLSHYSPRLSAHLRSKDVHVSIFAVGWFLCMFINPLTLNRISRVWDSIFAFGDQTFFAVAIAMLRANESALLQCTSTDELLMLLLSDRISVDIDIDDLLSSAPLSPTLATSITRLRSISRPEVITKASVLPLGSARRFAANFGFSEALSFANAQERERQAFNSKSKEKSRKASSVMSLIARRKSATMPTPGGQISPTIHEDGTDPSELKGRQRAPSEAEGVYDATTGEVGSPLSNELAMLFENEGGIGGGGMRTIGYGPGLTGEPQSPERYRSLYGDDGEEIPPTGELYVQALWRRFLKPDPWTVLLSSCLRDPCELAQSFVPHAFTRRARNRWAASDLALCSGVADRLFMAIDVNDSGHVSFEEFLFGISVFQFGTSEQRKYLCFRFFDGAKTGRVSHSSLINGFATLHSLYHGDPDDGVSARSQATEFAGMVCERVDVEAAMEMALQLERSELPLASVDDCADVKLDEKVDNTSNHLTEANQLTYEVDEGEAIPAHLEKNDTALASKSTENVSGGETEGHGSEAIDRSGGLQGVMEENVHPSGIVSHSVCSSNPNDLPSSTLLSSTSTPTTTNDPEVPINGNKDDRDIIYNPLSSSLTEDKSNSSNIGATHPQVNNASPSPLLPSSGAPTTSSSIISNVPPLTNLPSIPASRSGTHRPSLSHRRSLPASSLAWANVPDPAITRGLNYNEFAKHIATHPLVALFFGIELDM